VTSLDHSLIAQHPHRSDAMKTRLIVIVMTALAISGWSCFLLRSASRPGEGTGKRAATAAPVLESTSQVQGSGVRAGLGYDRADELANGGRLTYRRRVAVVVGASRGAGNFPDLAGIPVADAAAVAAVLAARFGFEDELSRSKKVL
jgi:hypothetical protein